MHVTYILYSLKTNKTYVGESKNSINRFYSHNIFATKGYTIYGRPWIMIHIEFFENRKLALKREKNLKSGQGRKWIKEYVLNQEHILGLISALG